MQLFFNKTSPYARKARVAVIELGLADAVELLDADPWPEPPALLAANPVCKVPALLLDNGQPVTESDTIVQVLDRSPGRDPARAALVPDGPDRTDTLARAALAQGLVDASFSAVLEGRRPAAQQWPEWVARQRRAVLRTLAHMEQGWALPPGRFDLGDIGLACALAYLDFRHGDLQWRLHHPSLAAWLDLQARRPSMLATRPDSV
jgi:glutathione S-transferase